MRACARRSSCRPSCKGLRVEPALIDEMLDDVNRQPGALPLLEYALLEVWKRRSQGMLTLKAYRESGGVEKALAQRAEAIFDSLPPDRQEIVQRIMLRLTHPGEGTEDTRRRAHVTELTTQIEEQVAVTEVVNKLADERLLTTSKDEQSGEQIVDVSHEALIRGWPRLRKWVDEDRAGLRTLLRLSEAAQEWAHENRDEGLLYRGARLETALEWRTHNESRMNDLEREFLTASESLKIRDIDEREAAQRRELENATKLAQAERKSRRRLQFYLTGIVALLAMSIGVSVFAYFQWKRLYQSDMEVAYSAHLRGDAYRVQEILNFHSSDQIWIRDKRWNNLWDLYHHELATLKGHSETVWSVAYSPDGKTLATGSDDQTVKLWDVRTFQEHTKYLLFPVPR